MAQQLAQEFTPELSQKYLASLLNPIDESESSAVGKARAAGAAGGLGAQASTGAEIGAIEAGAERSKADTISRFNMDVAGKRRDERLTDESRTFQDIERQKQNDFEKQMSIMGYEHDNAVAAGAKHSSQQGQLAGLGLGTASNAIGGFFGGIGGYGERPSITPYDGEYK
jgi:hypothetical protein